MCLCSTCKQIGNYYPKLTLMEPVQVMKLYDYCWFELEMFTTKPEPNLSTHSLNPDHNIQEETPKPEISRLPTMSRSMSGQMSSSESFRFDSLSPDTVLLDAPKFNTTLSGKGFNTEGVALQERHKAVEMLPCKNISSSWRRRKSESKSLTQLEFEELKGFMDLGFVFSEEDEDSSLISIIPGLQRLRKKDRQRDDFDDTPIQRPYLSEYWQVGDKMENPLLNWRIPTLDNEIYVKDSLKWWAHAVASAVR